MLDAFSWLVAVGGLVYAGCYAIQRYEFTVRERLAVAERMGEAERLHTERLAESDRARDIECARLQADAALGVAQLQNPAAPPLKQKTSEVTLPDDIEAFVMTWKDDFAREDQRGYIRHNYLELHNGDAAQTWQRVRRSCGIGELPE